MNLLQKVWIFFLNPKYQRYNYRKPLRRRVFLNLLFWSVIIAMGIGLFVAGLIDVLNLDVGENDISKMFKTHSPLYIFFLVIILAPIIEESIFRGPLVLFKKSSFFPVVFYSSIFLFGFIHLFNFESYENALWFVPFLFLPQLVTGVFLSFVRIRMGLGYSILFHALFNLTIIGPFLLFELLNLLFQ